MFHFKNYSPKSKYYADSNKLVAGKMKYETGSLAIEEFIGLNRKKYSFFVDANSKLKKAKDVNKKIMERISHIEYKDVFLNRKCLIHSINKIQSKNHRIRTYEFNKI